MFTIACIMCLSLVKNCRRDCYNMLTASNSYRSPASAQTNKTINKLLKFIQNKLFVEVLCEGWCSFFFNVLTMYKVIRGCVKEIRDRREQNQSSDRLSTH